MPTIGQIIAFTVLVLGSIVLFSTWLPNIKGAPWVPTRMKHVRIMLELADVKPDELVYDLGCGDGRVLVMAARKFKARAVGIEIDPFRFLWCQFLITILGLRKRVKVRFGDFFKKDISDADVVICYLLQSTNDILEKKLIEELSLDARIISNTFYFSSLPMVDMSEDAAIYLYSLDVEESEVCIEENNALNSKT